MSDTASKHLKCIHENLLNHISQLIDDNVVLPEHVNSETYAILTDIREAWEENSVQEALEFCENL
jgi:hypothetical protein